MTDLEKLREYRDKLKEEYSLRMDIKELEQLLSELDREEAEKILVDPNKKSLESLIEDSKKGIVQPYIPIGTGSTISTPTPNDMLIWN